MTPQKKIFLSKSRKKIGLVKKSLANGGFLAFCEDFKKIYLALQTVY